MITHRREAKNNGFTLVELLVVISIIGLLASTVLASVNSARDKGDNAATLQLIHQYRLALELSKDNDPTGSYPTLSPYPQSNQVCLGHYPGGECASGTCNGGIGFCNAEYQPFNDAVKKYIPSLPPLPTINTGIPGQNMFTGATYFCAALMDGVCEQYGIIFLLKENGQSCGDLGVTGTSGNFGSATICDSRSQ